MEAESELYLRMQAKEVWKCERCGKLVDPDDTIVEEHCSYEGEAWGHHFGAEKVYQVVSPCCQAFVRNDDGSYLGV